MNPLKHSSSLPEHFTPAGDKVAYRIVVDVMASGALRVYGNIEDTQWATAALENAKDAIKNQHAAKAEIAIVKPEDVTL